MSLGNKALYITVLNIHKVHMNIKVLEKSSNNNIFLKFFKPQYLMASDGKHPFICL